MDSLDAPMAVAVATRPATAYLLAASAVTYMLEAGGEAGLRDLPGPMAREPVPSTSAFRETFGLTIEPVRGGLEEDT